MSQRTFRTFNPLKNTFNNKSHTVNTVDEVNALLDKAKEAQLILEPVSEFRFHSGPLQKDST